MKLTLTEFIGSKFCVDTVDGQNVYSKISTSIDDGKIVIISFHGVKRITTAFLNAAIGQLYNEYSEDKIRQSIKFEEMEPISQAALVKVIERAKRYFANKEQFDTATRKAMDDS